MVAGEIPERGGYILMKQREPFNKTTKPTNIMTYPKIKEENGYFRIQTSFWSWKYLTSWWGVNGPSNFGNLNDQRMVISSRKPDTVVDERDRKLIKFHHKHSIPFTEACSASPNFTGPNFYDEYQTL